MNFGLLSIPPASCLNCQGARVSSPHRARLAGCSPEPGCAGFQPAFDATGGLLNQEEAMDATPARVMMWFSAFPCAFAPHPPCPLLPQGEKGESGRPEAQNERRNAGASKKPTPVSIPPAPFSHKERRGSFSVLMPETADNTQGLSKTSTPVSGAPRYRFPVIVQTSSSPLNDAWRW